MADKANYDAGTKYSFYLSFQVKEKDGTIKTYTNQTMLSYYKKKNKSQNYSINFTSEEDCRAAIAQYEKMSSEKGQAGRKFRVYFHYHAAAGGDDDHGSVDR